MERRPLEQVGLELGEDELTEAAPKLVAASAAGRVTRALVAAAHGRHSLLVHVGHTRLANEAESRARHNVKERHTSVLELVALLLIAWRRCGGLGRIVRGVFCLFESRKLCEASVGDEGDTQTHRVNLVVDGAHEEVEREALGKRDLYRSCCCCCCCCCFCFSMKLPKFARTRPQFVGRRCQPRLPCRRRRH